jgi:hypothetical protein
MVKYTAEKFNTIKSGCLPFAKAGWKHRIRKSKGQKAGRLPWRGDSERIFREAGLTQRVKILFCRPVFE